MTNEDALKWHRMNYQGFIETEWNRNEESPFMEAFEMSIRALEKQIKYRWHDLRKNPDDVPLDDYSVDEWYECVIENHEDDNYYPAFQYDEENFGYRYDIFDPVTYGYVDSEFKSIEEMEYEKVIAWREIELFGEEFSK